MTLTISEPEDVMMCIAYFLVALLSGVLAAKIRNRDRDLENREKSTRVLYELVKEFSSSITSRDVAQAAVESLSRLLNGKVKILLVNERGELSKKSFNDVKIDEKDYAQSIWTFENNKNAGWKTDTLSESRCLSIPLKAKSETVGVLIYYPREKAVITLEQQNILENICAQTGMALDRMRLQETAQKTKVLEMSEKLHQALLNSVSHELRTPLTAIIGSASAIMDKNVLNHESLREQLAQDVMDSSLRLNQVVENLLDMSRLNSGALSLKKEWVDLSDMLAGLPAKMKSLLKHHRVQFINECESCLVHIDERLFEHILVNLIGNATRYAPENSEISVKLWLHDKRVFLSIADQGPGIPEKHLTDIFEAFYRLPGSRTGGVGLGLAIVKALVEAHGGRVYAENRRDTQGAHFVIELPYEKPPAALERAT
ncbi:Sensor protein KdpD [compost metagenome]